MKKTLLSSCLLCANLFVVPAVYAEDASEQIKNTSNITFGTRLGEKNVEAFSDLLVPMVSSEKSILFFNPRFSLRDEGENEINAGVGLRRLLNSSFAVGGNVYFDSRESAYNNRFNQLGIGAELLSDYVDLRANYYNADNKKKVTRSGSPCLNNKHSVLRWSLCLF